VTYLAIRYSVLGGLGDDPNPVIALLGAKSRVLTMLGVVPEWTRLLLWPARLAADYSPPQIAIFAAFASGLVPAVGILIGCVMLCVMGWRGARVTAFGILWVVVALFPVSNLVLRSGVIVAERTLFLPTIGAVLAVGATAAWAAARWRASASPRTAILLLPVIVVLALGVVRSAARQRVWRTKDDFFRSVVEDAPLGYRAHYMHGMWLFEKGRRAEGERHVRAAIALFPYDAAPYTDLATEYRKSGLCAPARQLYRRALDLGASRPEPRVGLIACLLQDGEFAEASAEARRGVERRGSAEPQFRRLLAMADSAAAARRAPVSLSGAPRTGPR
jgi:protein O-mannosyl-transferase